MSDLLVWLDSFLDSTLPREMMVARVDLEHDLSRSLNVESDCPGVLPI